MRKLIFLILFVCATKQLQIKGAGIEPDDGRGKEIAEVLDFQSDIDSEESEQENDSEEDKRILEVMQKSYFNTLQEKYTAETKNFLDFLQNQPQNLPTDINKLIIEYCQSPNYEFHQTLNNQFKSIQLPDGFLATCGEDNTINIMFKQHDNTFSTMQTLTGHIGRITSMLHLKNGNLVSYSENGTIKIWKQNRDHSWVLLQILQAHYQKICSVIELKNGDLVSCSRDNTIKIWNQFSDGHISFKKSLEGHENDVLQVIELSSGDLASFSLNNVIKIWHKNTHAEHWYCRENLFEHTGDICSIINLNNGCFASCAWDSTIKIWYLNSHSAWRCEQTLTGHSMVINSIIQLRNGNLASCSFDKTIKVWQQNPNSFECLGTLTGHERDVLGVIELSSEDLVSYDVEVIKIWKKNFDNSYICIDTLDMINDKTSFSAIWMRVNSISELDDGYLAVNTNEEIKIYKRPFSDFMLDKQSMNVTNKNDIQFILNLYQKIKNNPYKTAAAFTALALMVQYQQQIMSLFTK